MNQSNRSLARILTDLKEAIEESGRDLDNIDRRLLAAFQVRQREARESLPVLKGEYRQKLLANAVAIFAFGPLDKQVEFAAHAQRSAECLVFDVDEVYQKLSGPVWATMGERGGEFTITQTVALTAMIQQFMLDNGLRDALIPGLTGLDGVYLRSAKETLEYVKDVIQRSMGDALLSVYFGNQIAERALAAEIVDPPLKVVIVNGTSKQTKGNSLAASFKLCRALNLTAETAVDESFAIGVVEKVLKRGEPKAAKPPKSATPAQNTKPEGEPAATQPPASSPEGTNQENKTDGN